VNRCSDRSTSKRDTDVISDFDFRLKIDESIRNDGFQSSI